MNAKEKRMRQLRPLVESDIVLGKPLAGSICNDAGRVLVKPGLVISGLVQRDRLLSKHLYIRIPSTPVSEPLSESRSTRPSSSVIVQGCSDTISCREEWLSPFDLVDQLSEEYEYVVSELKSSDSKVCQRGVTRVQALAQNIQVLTNRYVSPLLAALQLNSGRDYGTIKSLHVAAICELLGKRVGLAINDRLSLLCAALSYDLAMPEGALQTQAAPLSKQQQRDIKDHPEKARQLLFGAGVRDRLWLASVLQHHERADGSGYPEGLKGPSIALPSKILAITDTYCAMVRPRADRAEVVAKDVLEEFFEARASSIDAEMVALFITELGVYPPGTVVRLACGELAVVTDKGRDSSLPQVDTIILAEGKQLHCSVPRDSSNPAYRVIEIESMPEQLLMSEVLGEVWPSLQTPFEH